MTLALEITNDFAALLNLVVAAVFLFIARSSAARTRMPYVLAAFFLVRAVDRMASPGSHVFPYSIEVDLAINVVLIALLVLLTFETASYLRSVSGTLTEARALASRDALTGLLNRRGWERQLDELLIDARVANKPLVAMLLDLDHFKRLNDEHGHARGDEMLKECAGAWQRIVRGGDVLGRYGGEEFIVVLCGAEQDTAVDIAERLRIATPFGQTCSVGVATWDGIEQVDTLLARADAALYRAKANGRNQVVVDRVLTDASPSAAQAPRRP